MTFEDVDKILPNGFHDAKLRTFSLDLQSRSIVIGMNLLVGVPEDRNPEARRNGTLKVALPYLLVIDAPEAHHPIVGAASWVNVDGDSVAIGQDPRIDSLLPALPPGATLYRFFVEDWGSFIYLAGADVELSWEDDR
jgi:hypothetical protein